MILRTSTLAFLALVLPAALVARMSREEHAARRDSLLERTGDGIVVVVRRSC